MEEREMTYGEKAVGLKFNPAGDSVVNEIKELYAKIIDIMDAERKSDSADKDPESRRLASIAITEAQSAQMWAVKAVTWGK